MNLGMIFFFCGRNESFHETQFIGEWWPTKPDDTTVRFFQKFHAKKIGQMMKSHDYSVMGKTKYSMICVFMKQHDRVPD